MELYHLSSLPFKTAIATNSTIDENMLGNFAGTKKGKYVGFCTTSIEKQRYSYIQNEMRLRLRHEEGIPLIFLCEMRILSSNYLSKELNWLAKGLPGC